MGSNKEDSPHLSAFPASLLALVYTENFDLTHFLDHKSLYPSENFKLCSNLNDRAFEL